MDERIELTIAIEAEDAEEEALELLVRDLVTQIQEGTDIGMAESSHRDTAVGEPADIRHVATMVGHFPPATIPRLVRLLEAWLRRRRAVRISLNLGGDSLELRQDMSDQRIRDMVASWLDGYDLGFAGSLPPPPPAPASLGEAIPHPPARAGLPVGSRPPPQPAPTFADEVERALQALIPGRFAFNPPAQMRQGQEESVTIGVVRSKDMDNELLASLRGSGVPILEDIRTASLMSVELRGDHAFEIRSQSETEQPVTMSDITNWEFNVRALQPGTHTLTVIAALVLQVPGHPDLRRSLPVLERSVQVRVAPVYVTGQFVRSNWQWIIGTGVAVSGGVAAWVKLAH